MLLLEFSSSNSSAKQLRILLFDAIPLKWTFVIIQKLICGGRSEPSSTPGRAYIWANTRVKIVLEYNPASATRPGEARPIERTNKRTCTQERAGERKGEREREGARANFRLISNWMNRQQERELSSAQLIQRNDFLFCARFKWKIEIDWWCYRQQVQASFSWLAAYAVIKKLFWKQIRFLRRCSHRHRCCCCCRRIDDCRDYLRLTWGAHLLACYSCNE